MEIIRSPNRPKREPLKESLQGVRAFVISEASFIDPAGPKSALLLVKQFALTKSALPDCLHNRQIRQAQLPVKSSLPMPESKDGHRDFRDFR